MTNIARLKPNQQPTEADLHADMIALSRKFFALADRHDHVFICNTDKRDIQRGAFCAEAVTCRYVGSQLRELARSID